MLTQKEVTSLKKKSSAYYVWDDTKTKGTGRLGIKVLTSGSKAWVFRYFRSGKRAFIQLGRFPELSLSDARQKAKEYGLQLKQGIDPKDELARVEKEYIESAKREAQQGTIKQLFHGYTSKMQEDGKRTYEAVLSALEREVYPHVPPTTKAKGVTTQDLVTVLAHMIRRGSVTQSNRVRSYLMAAFNYGLKHDNDPANYIEDAKFGLSLNPVSAIPKQKSGERVGQNYLELEEVHVLLDDLSHDFTTFPMGNSMRNLIKLCIFSGGQRPYELFASEWSAINWREKTFLVTKEVSKNKREHLFPLTESAIEVLKHQQKIAGGLYIFPHKKNEDQHVRGDSLSQAITRYREASSIKPFVARDIRRTCKTLMGEIGISKSLRDRIQNHALNDVSSKHYDRYDYLSEKRVALESWERQLLNELKHESNVVEMEVAR